MAPTGPIAYLNGQWLPQEEACIPHHDAGFVWGATITDTCRTFRHQPYRLADHLARFQQSCQLAHVPLRATKADLQEIAQKLVLKNCQLLPSGQDLAIVFLATPGPIGYFMGLPGGPGSGQPTLLVHTFPLPFSRYRRFFLEGIRLCISQTRQIPSDCIDPHIKQRSRLHWWIAEQEVHAHDPLASALLLDQAGHITETATSNVLVVSQGVLYTPTRDKVLGGVSLQVVRELCQHEGIPLVEKQLSLEDCLHAEEILLTCTSFCLAPAQTINQHRLACPGPMFEKLLDAWNRSLGLDLRAQILSDS